MSVLYMFYVAGSKTSFRCHCGCNLFLINPTNPQQINCNGCDCVYEGEKEDGSKFVFEESN